MPSRGCRPSADADEQDALLADVLERALDAGQAVGQARPRPAAGAARGGRRRRRRLRADDHLRGRRSRRCAAPTPPPLEHHAPARVTHPQHHSSTLPLLHELRGHRRAASTPAPWIARLEALGDSVLVVGDAHTLKVHVHTDDPERGDRAVRRRRRGLAPRRRRHARADGRARRAGSATARGAPATCGVLAVVDGRRACASCSRSLGAHALDGGATLNPSTYELLAGIHDVPAEEVVVLPNSPNVIMAAERAAELSEKAVRVVPHALAAGRPGRRRRARPDARRRRRTPPRWRRRSPTCAPARSPRPPATTPHGPLPPRRRGRLRRRGARRLGRARGDARGRARRARPRRRAA